MTRKKTDISSSSCALYGCKQCGSETMWLSSGFTQCEGRETQPSNWKKEDLQEVEVFHNLTNLSRISRRFWLELAKKTDKIAHDPLTFCLIEPIVIYMLDDAMEMTVIENLKKIQQLAHCLRENNSLPKREVHLAQSIVKLIELQLTSLEEKKNKGKKVKK